MVSNPHERMAALQTLPVVCFAVLSGLIDLLMGIFAKITSIFWAKRLPSRADTPTRRRRGLTVVLGGIEGPSLFNHSMVLGVLQSRYRGCVVRFDWNAGIPLVRSLVNLIHRRHKERQSDKLAGLIADYQRAHPDAPICLVAQSGGCWIVVRALEKLATNFKVHTAVLIAPSISPGYDISRAAARCAGGMVSVGGPGDYIFLGLGTLLFGTSDRVFSPSAGWIGWHHRPPGFVEQRWHPAWLKYGYIGNHTSSAARRFVAGVVGPRLAVAHVGEGANAREGSSESPSDLG